jgi:hypothetical protein
VLLLLSAAEWSVADNLLNGQQPDYFLHWVMGLKKN